MWIEDNVRERRYDVDCNFDGWRLDQYLANRIDGMSRSQAGRIAKGGDVEVYPRRKIKAGTRLRDGDEVVIREYLDPEFVQDEEVEIAYEDEAMMVINKPAGMLVHETASIRLNTVTHYLQRQGLSEVHPVHRLDRETSGALVCGRGEEAIRRLSEAFGGDGIDKTYRALVIDEEKRWGPGDEATLERSLGFEAFSPLPHKVWDGDKRALTHVSYRGEGRCRAHGHRLVDLEVRIETGRQHQIRVHLAMEETPIAGDKLYAESDEFFMAICDRPDDEDLRSRMCFDTHSLHAWRVGLDHPRREERVVVETGLPTRFSEL